MLYCGCVSGNNFVEIISLPAFVHDICYKHLLKSHARQGIRFDHIFIGYFVWTYLVFKQCWCFYFYTNLLIVVVLHQKYAIIQ